MEETYGMDEELASGLDRLDDADFDLNEHIGELRETFATLLDAGDVAEMDQSSARLRESIAGFGVDFTDRNQAKAMLAMFSAMNEWGVLHARNHSRHCCHSDLEAFGIEAINVAGLATKMIVDRWG